jgi:hypothetical protein
MNDTPAERVHFQFQAALESCDIDKTILPTLRYLCRIPVSVSCSRRSLITISVP